METVSLCKNDVDTLVVLGNGLLEVESGCFGNSQVMDRICGSRLLLVEDDDFNQLMALELLTSAGAHIVIAENGREAVEKVSSQQFDAVLMDIRMPVMDGYDATREIRCNPAFKNLPIIAMTAMVTEQDTCRAAGMDDQISKPIDPAELYRVLGKWITRDFGRSPVEPSPSIAGQHAVDSAFPAELPGISLSQGLAYSLGKLDFYRENLVIFMQTKGKCSDEIRAELASGNIKNAVLHAHSMKTVAGTIGATQLAETSALLEHALDAGQQDSFPGLLDMYEQQLTIVISGLAEAFGR